MTTRATQIEQERRRTRSVGWWSLLCWASLGLLLEAGHALKLRWLLDDPLRREWLRWGHAHGVGLSLVLLAYAAAGGGTGPTRGTRRYLLVGAWLLPLGFSLGALWHYEADPGPAIVLTPVGAVALWIGLWRAAREVSAA